MVSFAIPTVPSADRADDPVAAIEAFLERHHPDPDGARVPTCLARLRDDIEANRQTDITCSVLLSGLACKDRAAAEALVADLRVFLTQRRNSLLHEAHAETLTEDRIDRLFTDVCMGEGPFLDPDMPKVAAQSMVQAAPQTLLVSRVLETWRALRAELEAAAHEADRWPIVLPRVGRFLCFLRWVPYDWAEEVSLEMVDRICPPRRKDRLRLWVSVLRVFFCRPSVGADSVARLLDGVGKRFGWPVPRELDNLVRAILIKGGEHSGAVLRQRFETQPETYETAYFIDVMAMVDKPAAARRLLDHRDSLVSRLGTKTYLRLLTATGETGQRALGELRRLWEGGDATTRLHCLESIAELHVAGVMPFLISWLAREQSPSLRFRIVETVTAAAGASDLGRLAAAVRQDPSVIRYYAMHLVHKRLLDAPMLLLQQEDAKLLHDLQRARSDLYGIYRQLHVLGQALVQAVRQGDGGRAGGGKAAATVRHAAQVVAAAAILLRDAEFMAEGVRDNVFGPLGGHDRTSALLDEEDAAEAAQVAAGSGRGTAALIEKARRTMEFLRDVLLYQEWFVREVPFVLNEDMGELLDKIRRAAPLEVEKNTAGKPLKGGDLQTTFGIFCECTRQGLYLTDVLLRHISLFPRERWPDVIRNDLTRRRIMVADGSLIYYPGDPLARHLQFTTFAHDYRYGKESLEQPSLLYLWLRYMKVSQRVEAALEKGPWPSLPPHPDVPPAVGPLTERMYRQHAAEAEAVFSLVASIHEHARSRGLEIRVIPNLTYGLFCVAPIMDKILQRGIHISLAGISSQFCDDENVNRFTLQDENVFPLKRYLFSNASNYGTLNGDRILIVIDGTMEPIDRHDAGKIRLPKAYRGFVNHLAAVNYVRARYGYKMENPERDVASALNLPLRFMRNVARTHSFRHLVDSLLLCFDPAKLARAHEAAGTGKTYYSFAQWNPDGLPARVGPIGYEKHELACCTVEDLPCPSLLFVSMNSIFNEVGVAAYFDNNPEVEHPRMFIGPQGVKIDIGWPEPYAGITIDIDHVRRARSG